MGTAMSLSCTLIRHAGLGAHVDSFCELQAASWRCSSDELIWLYTVLRGSARYTQVPNYADSPSACSRLQDGRQTAGMRRLISSMAQAVQGTKQGTLSLPELAGGSVAGLSCATDHRTVEIQILSGEAVRPSAPCFSVRLCAALTQQTEPIHTYIPTRVSRTRHALAPLRCASAWKFKLMPKKLG